MADSPIVFVRHGNRVEIEMRSTGALLAHCYIGDDLAVESIADILSRKRLPKEAMALRQMAMDARKPQPGPGRVGWLRRLIS